MKKRFHFDNITDFGDDPGIYACRVELPCGEVGEYVGQASNLSKRLRFYSGKCHRWVAGRSYQSNRIEYRMFVKGLADAVRHGRMVEFRVIQHFPKGTAKPILDQCERSQIKIFGTLNSVVSGNTAEKVRARYPSIAGIVQPDGSNHELNRRISPTLRP